MLYNIATYQRFEVNTDATLRKQETHEMVGQWETLHHSLLIIKQLAHYYFAIAVIKMFPSAPPAITLLSNLNKHDDNIGLEAIGGSPTDTAHPPHSTTVMGSLSWNPGRKSWSRVFCLCKWPHYPHCHVVMLPLTDISIKLLEYRSQWSRERLQLNSNCWIRNERTHCMCLLLIYVCLLSAITLLLLKKYPVVDNWLYYRARNRLWRMFPDPSSGVSNWTVQCAYMEQTGVRPSTVFCPSHSALMKNHKDWIHVSFRPPPQGGSHA